MKWESSATLETRLEEVYHSELKGEIVWWIKENASTTNITPTRRDEKRHWVWRSTIPCRNFLETRLVNLREELDINNNSLLDVVQSKKNDWTTSSFLTGNIIISSRKIYEKFRRHNCRFSHYLDRTKLLHLIPTHQTR